MYERFTNQVRIVLRLANDEATRRGHCFICPEHILLALLDNRSGIAMHLLQPFIDDVKGLREELEMKMSQRAATPTTPQAKPVLERAIQESKNLNHNYAGTEHLLIALLLEPAISAAFAATCVDSEALRDSILHQVRSNDADV